jgi:hypothetical protein
MARGWESKSVEAQQADAAERKERRPRISPAQAETMRQIEGLALSRSRVVQELEASLDPRHRLMLQEALADLERKIRALTST